MNDKPQKRVVIARSNAVDPDSRVEKEANTLAKNGYSVTLLAWDRSANYKIKEDVKTLNDGSVRRVSFGAKADFGAGFKSLVPFLKFQKRLCRWLRKHSDEYDVAHLCDYDTALFGARVARRKKKKVIFDVFDYKSHDASTLPKKLFKKWEDSIINKADATVICTEKRREQIASATPKRLTVIHNTPEAVVPAEEQNRPDDGVVRIVYVGILQDRRLLKEIMKVVAGMEGVELHIGGFGKYEAYVKEQAEAHANIVWHGKLPYAETLRLESACDIMLAVYDPTVPNHVFAAPNKFYEGLFLGKPLIMVKNTGMSEVVEENGIGEIITYSEEGFKTGLENLIARRSEWADISATMKELYRTQYNWKEMETRLLDLYASLENEA